MPPRSRPTSYRPGAGRPDAHDTDFEEDDSDLEEFSGRRSEDSIGKRSASTLSSFEELRTPGSQYAGFDNFNFQFEAKGQPLKSTEGPVGPHLFRMSQESTSKEEDVYLTMSPPASPEAARAGPLPSPRAPKQKQKQKQQTQPQAPARQPSPAQPPAKHIEQFDEAPRTSVPLRTWSPQQVAEWMHALKFERTVVDTFFINDIAGTTLIDLQYDDLKELGIASFGQRHRLWNEIKALKDSQLPAPGQDGCFSPPAAAADRTFEAPEPSPAVPVVQPAAPKAPSPNLGSQRRGRSQRRGNDIISPADSVSIVAIEQLLPKPPKCTKCSSPGKCAKWRKYQREIERLTAGLPVDSAAMVQQAAAAAQAQVAQGGLAPIVASPVDSGFGASIVVPSVIASSDVLGATNQPPKRLDPNALQTVQHRDPQENVRQFLQFQHLDTSAQSAPAAEPSTPPYEMFPPLASPTGPAPAAPHHQLRRLPKLAIPTSPDGADQTFSPGSRSAIPRSSTRASQRGGARTPLTALDPAATPRAQARDLWRVASPASEMDVPVTAIPMGPVERDVSSSVPPDMRFGGAERSADDEAAAVEAALRPRFRPQPLPPTFTLPSVFPPRNAGRHGAPAGGSMRRAASTSGTRRHPHRSALAPVPAREDEDQIATDGDDAASDAATEIEDDAATHIAPATSGSDATQGTATVDPRSAQHSGWMKKRKTKMLRHEWQEHHFRLRGTRLAMHAADDAAGPTAADDEARALECIDVDDYAVAVAAAGNGKLNAAFKRLHLGAGRKGLEPGAFAFQLTPAAGEASERRALASHAKTHHFAVRTQTERIDWMRELMLARARKQKDATHTSFE